MKMLRNDQGPKGVNDKSIKIMKSLYNESQPKEKAAQK